MTLNTLWFILIAVLYVGFFVLEGFDFGVGMLLPFLAKDDTRRRVILNTVGPHWDGNEVWLLTAGGATFAAFPQWYATMFSGFYLALFLLLLALIVRGVAFEFRSQLPNPRWRAGWDIGLAVEVRGERREQRVVLGGHAVPEFVEIRLVGAREAGAACQVVVHDARRVARQLPLVQALQHEFARAAARTSPAHRSRRRGWRARARPPRPRVPSAPCARAPARRCRR